MQKEGITIMQRNECARVSVEHLAFNRIDQDPCFITIPVRGRRNEVVVCENTMNGKALVRHKVNGKWCRYLLDEDTTIKIYKKLKEDT